MTLGTDMTLDKAVEILHLLFGHIYEGNEFDRDQAILLGIEAIKREKNTRSRAIAKRTIFTGIALLPGETIEGCCYPYNGAPDATAAAKEGIEIGRHGC